MNFGKNLINLIIKGYFSPSLIYTRQNIPCYIFIIFSQQHAFIFIYIYIYIYIHLYIYTVDVSLLGLLIKIELLTVIPTSN